MDQQKVMLSTPQYQIRKDKKSGLLVSPSKVTVVGVVDQNTGLDEDALANVLTGSGQQELFTVSHHSADDFVSKHDFDLLSNQLEEKFARFKALLTQICFPHLKYRCLLLLPLLRYLHSHFSIRLTPEPPVW